MAKRAREHRKDIPGYDETRPPRDERKRQHRQVRHAANQMLSMVDDPDELTLPDVKRHRHDDRGGRPGGAATFPGVENQVLEAAGRLPGHEGPSRLQLAGHHESRARRVLSRKSEVGRRKSEVSSAS